MARRKSGISTHTTFAIAMLAICLAAELQI